MRKALLSVSFFFHVAVIAAESGPKVDQELASRSVARQAAERSVAEVENRFGSLLERLRANKRGDGFPLYAQYFELNITGGPKGKVLEQTLGFECEAECSFEIDRDFEGSFEAQPATHYKFAGWSGGACEAKPQRDASICTIKNSVSRTPPKAFKTSAEYTREISYDSKKNTAEFSVTNIGFAGLYNDEIAPVTCYPTIDDCKDSGVASWRSPHNFATGDFDGNGLQDMVVIPVTDQGYEKANPTRVQIYLNDGEGGLYNSKAIFAEGKSVGMQKGYRVAVNDFNGDGRDDFVVGTFGVISGEPHKYQEFIPERYVLYLSGTDGKLHDAGNQIAGQENGAIMPDMNFAHDLASGDIDGDGDVDFWMSDRLFENDGSGYFSIPIRLKDLIIDKRDFTMSSLISDFDADGIGDLAIFKGDPVSVSYIFLSEGKRDLRERSIVSLPTGLFGLENTKHNFASSADIDGDGDLDIVIGQTRAQPYYKGRAIQVLINEGNGVFVDDTLARLGDQSYYTDGPAVNQGEGAVYLLDVNGDGTIDIFDRRGPGDAAEAAGPSAGVSIWLNDGAGYFVDVPPSVFPYLEPRDMAPRNGVGDSFRGRLMDSAPIDLNGDGAIDIVSYVETNSYPDWDFGESTLYTLTANKKLKAADYKDK